MANQNSNIKWAILIFSSIFSIIITLLVPNPISIGVTIATFFLVFILCFIILFVICWIITKVYPRSMFWGIISWIIVIIIITFLGLLVIGMFTNLSGSILTLGITNSSYISNQNSTFSKYGFSFEYPSNFVPFENGFAGDSNANENNGQIQLNATVNNGFEDNITIDWEKTYHRAPDIPTVYTQLYSAYNQKSDYKNWQVYNLNTYPLTICGDPTFIGRAKFNQGDKNTLTNEGMLIWNHPSQDRLYMIDIASTNDFYPYVYDNLGRYADTFNCTDS